MSLQPPDKMPERIQEEQSSVEYVVTPDQERKLLRKIDWRLLPILGALYSIALIDRTNV
jgi:hypothetical protein